MTDRCPHEQEEVGEIQASERRGRRREGAGDDGHDANVRDKHGGQSIKT